MTLSCCLNRFTGAILGSAFLTLRNIFTIYGLFYLLAIVAFIFTLFYYRYVPETKGKKLEDME